MFLFGSENLTLYQNIAIFSIYNYILKDRSVLYLVMIDPTQGLFLGFSRWGGGAFFEKGHFCEIIY